MKEVKSLHYVLVRADLYVIYIAPEGTESLS